MLSGHGTGVTQNTLDDFRRHVLGDEGLSDAARHDEAQASVDDLLVLPHQSDQLAGGRQIAGDVAQIGLRRIKIEQVFIAFISRPRDPTS